MMECLRRKPERKEEFRSFGGLTLKRVWTPLDTVDIPQADIGLPGRYPVTRGMRRTTLCR